MAKPVTLRASGTAFFVLRCLFLVLIGWLEIAGGVAESGPFIGGVRLFQALLLAGTLSSLIPSARFKGRRADIRNAFRSHAISNLTLATRRAAVLPNPLHPTRDPIRIVWLVAIDRDTGSALPVWASATFDHHAVAACRLAVLNGLCQAVEDRS